jgi:hypothetical protein
MTMAPSSGDRYGMPPLYRRCTVGELAIGAPPARLDPV